MNRILSCGIPSIDRLVTGNIDLTAPDQPIAACIQGADGTGKSILAMHFASWHALITQSEGNPHDPTVVYLSTDLNFKLAQKTWNDFALRFPVKRIEALHQSFGGGNCEFEPYRQFAAGIRDQWEEETFELGFEQYSPTGRNGIRQIEELGNYPLELGFVDLAKESAGDEWGFVNRICNHLRSGDEDPPSLIILDAIEGIETLGGELDAYGERHSRRSRIAQLVRNAKNARCHIIMIIEEGESDRRLPEHFVSDVVIRLRSDETDGYSQRTIEIEKARGISHIRGLHDFAIRNGEGGITENQDHLDSPNTRMNIGEADSRDEVKLGQDRGHDSVAYIEVFPSLHARSRIDDPKLFQPGEQIPSPMRVPEIDSWFGLGPLDESLAQSGTDEADVRVDLSDSETVATGSVTTLVGPPGTYKSRLARSFLSRAFVKTDRLSNDVGKYVFDPKGVAILLATYPIGRVALVNLVKTHVSDLAIDEKVLASRVFVRRLPLQHLSPPEFINIVERYISEGIKTLGSSTPRHKLRLVVDDWFVLRTIHPTLDCDPLLLHSLVTRIRARGLTSLVVGTSKEHPLKGREDAFSANDLRILDGKQVVTWNVPFFGRRSTAISAFSGGACNPRTSIYELRPETESSTNVTDQRHWEARYLEYKDRLRVDTHFELYSGVEDARPVRIPLVVKLYSGGHDVAETVDNDFISRVKSVFADVFGKEKAESVVKFTGKAEYKKIAAFAESLDESNLNHSLVVQVDEFWAIGRNGVFADLTSYINAQTCFNERGKLIPDRENDPYSHFQPQEGSKKKQFLRRDFFITPDDGYKVDASRYFDRVPFSGDFGFILARSDLWFSVKDRRVPVGYDFGSAGLGPNETASVSQIWNALCNANLDKLPTLIHDGKALSVVTWQMFFNACRAVQESTGAPAFSYIDDDETFCAVILEIWASSITSFLQLQKAQTSIDLDSVGFGFCTSRNAGNEFGASLRTLVRQYRHLLFYALNELYCATIHRGDLTIACGQRHWFSTASVATRQQSNLIPLRIPGSFSVRGDWFLAMAAGSRSKLLGEHAIDILTSRKMSYLRLRDGIGLPVRDVTPAQLSESNDLTLTSIGIPEQMKLLPTGILRYDSAANRVEPYELGQFMETTAPKKGRNLNWLFRSRIRNFDRQTFYFVSWCKSLFENEEIFRPELLDSFRRLFFNSYIQFSSGVRHDQKTSIGSLSDGDYVARKLEETWNGGLSTFDAETTDAIDKPLKRFEEKVDNLLATLRESGG